MKNRLAAHAIIVTLATLLIGCPKSGSDSQFERTCHGNLETFSKQIIKAGITYKLSYEVSGSRARVRFVGREFDANAERGKSWRGYWIKRVDNDVYFSFLPDEGGTIKFEFGPDQWYSGNCAAGSQ